MNTGALVNETVAQWPTAFDEQRTYVHLDDAFDSRKEISFETVGGSVVRFKVGDKKKKLEYYCDGAYRKEIKSLAYKGGQLTDQDAELIGGGSLPVKSKDAILYQLHFL